MAVPYKQRSERMMVVGFEGFEATTPRRRIRERVSCSGDVLPFAWMRTKVCTTLKEGLVEPISGSRDASKFLHDAIDITHENRELAIVLSLDRRNKPLSVFIAHIGGTSFSFIDPGTLFQAVVLSGASSFIFAHNHPSGDANASPEDIEVTERLKKGAKLIGSDLVDSIVLTQDPTRYFSMLDRGLLRGM